jgi:hypothetical protein
MKNIEEKKKEGGGMEVETLAVDSKKKSSRWDAAPVDDAGAAAGSSRWDQPTPVRKRNRWDDAGATSDSSISSDGCVVCHLQL